MWSSRLRAGRGLAGARCHRAGFLALPVSRGPPPAPYLPWFRLCRFCKALHERCPDGGFVLPSGLPFPRSGLTPLGRQFSSFLLETHRVSVPWLQMKKRKVKLA